MPETLRISSILTREPDTAYFSIKKFGSRTYTPTVGEETIITGDGTRIFAGRIVRVEESYDKLELVEYRISCIDYTRDLDQRLVVESYTNQTINAIIADIRTKYMHASITIANVDAPVTIQKISFNYEQVSQCIKQLAEMVNYDWYIDYNKDIHFFAKTDNAAPFALSDTGGKYIYDSLIIRKDITPVRNTIYVRGGEYEADPFTASIVADGQTHIFNTGYKFSDLAVTTSGQQKSIGIDYIDDPGSYDALYNFQEKLLKFREDKKPSVNTVVQWSGHPWIPVIVKYRSASSIAAFSATEGTDGIYEYKIIDKSIKSKAAARQRARAEILAYAATVSEGEFKTYQTTLRVGQRITVQSDLRGVNAAYIINRIEIEPFGNQGNLIHRVGLMSTRTFDMIQLLQKLLTEKDKEISVSEDEVLDEVETSEDNITISEAVTYSMFTPPYRWGPHGDAFKWNLGEWS
jgi:hypothetical protein